MPLFGRLQAPSFDLCWLDSHKEDAYIMIPGGGGASKTGVKNMIQIAGVSDKGFNFVNSISTDIDDKSMLCTSVTNRTLDDISVTCAAADRQVMVYQCNLIKGNYEFQLKTVYEADPQENGCVNCLVLTPVKDILTAGDDGTIRVWTLNIQTWKVIPRCEMKGHTGSIMSLQLHPTEPLCCSASKDGTLRLWNLLSYSNESVTYCNDGITSNPTASNTNPTSSNNSSGNKATSALECRSCGFTPDGHYIYSIQSGKRGSATVIKWQLSTEVVKKEHSDEESIQLKPLKALIVSKVPCTRLKISPLGNHLVVGTSDGSLILLDIADTKKHIMKVMKVTLCHDLPVTGLDFVPSLLLSKLGYDDVIVSCSADYSVAMIPIGGSWYPYTTTIILITIVIFFILCVLFLLLFKYIPV